MRVVNLHLLHHEMRDERLAPADVSDLSASGYRPRKKISIGFFVSENRFFFRS